MTLKPLRRRRMALFSSALLVLTLAACGGGGNDAPATRTAHAYFSNLTDVAATQVRVVNEAGAQMYSGGVSCGDSGSCELTMANYNPPGKLSFLFYNDSNQLVTASEALFTDRDAFSVGHSHAMLGTYLFKGMVKKYQLDPQDLSTRLSAFFINVDSPDGQTDDFEELGMLYTKKRLENGFDEDRFYTELKAALDAHVVLRPSYFGAQTVTPAGVMALATEVKKCPWYASALGKSAEVFGKFIPYVGEKVGEAIGKTIDAAADVTCDEENNTQELVEEANKKLDEIQKKLDLMDSKIDAMGISLAEVRNAVYDVMNLTAQINYRGALQNIVNSTNIYRNLLGTKYKNLSDYAAKNGGLAGMSRDTTVVKLLTDIGNQKKAFETLGDRTTLESMAKVLENKCSDISKMTGDVVATRGQCNLTLAKLATEYSQSQAAMAMLLKDEILMVNTAISAASNPETITSKYTSPFNSNWANAQAEVNTKLNENMTAFTGALGESYVEVIKGIPGGAKAAISFSASCNDGKVSPTPNISAWQPNATEPYVETYCYNSGRMVKSSFYYESNISGNDGLTKYANVLGVVVKIADNSAVTDRATPWEKAGLADLYTPVANEDYNRGLAMKLATKNFRVFNGDTPKWLMEPGADHFYDERCAYAWDDYRCATYERVRYALKKLESLTADGYEYYSSRYREDTIWTSAHQDIFATVSYTPDASAARLNSDDGKTIVWQVQVVGGKSGQYFDGPYKNSYRLRCITPDCSVEGNKLKFNNNKSVRYVSVSGGANEWKTFKIER